MGRGGGANKVYNWCKCKFVLLLLNCPGRVEEITKYLDINMYHPVIHKHVKIPDKYEIGTSYFLPSRYVDF